MRSRPAVVAVVLGSALAVLAGCASSSTTSSGTGGSTASTAGNPTVTTTTPAPGPPALPADVAKATRTVDIKATDDLKFSPAQIAVHPGETIAFTVTDAGAVSHEFDVGDGAFQADHEAEMRSMPAGMAMPDEPTGFTLMPGQTKSIAFTFPTAGTTMYGCHQPGHYAAGMKGTITVA
ncbi:MAG: plastocyanin/azurin family copper-binding protein [Acidimicrobiales bacterium]